ncbi:MAG: hypothetical protein KJZ75_02010 [Hyphomonadaceae bacterium]|nr:hypothetical protein [Hyphomonadaceae bacterium]GIK49963.1 MAG: hypothetical protein BroJett013_26600 [Alphaproteobacteria bacterium]
MFGYVIDLSGVRSWLRDFADAQWRMLGGLAFMIIAIAAIQYDELVAPEVSRLSDSWSSAATDFSRKLASFTL